MNHEISEETLHAFIDGELALDESERLIARLREDPPLAARVCELRDLQSMLRIAYAEPPARAASQRRWTHGERIPARFLAGVLLIVGLASGWLLRGLAPGDLGIIQVAHLVGTADAGKVLLHLDTAAPERMQHVLDSAEHILDAAERNGRTVQVEIVANSHGLGLLRAHVSPHAARIRHLHARHDNLEFVACGQTIARLAHEGKIIELLPVTRTAPSAIGEIVDRLQQGWTYIRV